MSRLIIVLLSFAIFPVVSIANDSLNVAIIGRVPLTALDFDIYNDTMICVGWDWENNGGYFGQFYDISNPDQPEAFGRAIRLDSGHPECRLVQGSTVIVVSYDYNWYGNERHAYQIFNWSVMGWNLNSGSLFELDYGIKSDYVGRDISPMASNIGMSGGVAYASSEEFGTIGYDFIANRRVNNIITSRYEACYAGNDTILLATNGRSFVMYDTRNREDLALIHWAPNPRGRICLVSGGFVSEFYGSGYDSIAAEVYSIGQDSISTRSQIIIPECLRGESNYRRLFWVHDHLFVVVSSLRQEETHVGLAYYNLEDLDNPVLEGYYQGMSISKICGLKSGRLLARIPNDNRIFEIAIGDDARAIASEIMHPREFSLIAFPNPFNSTLFINYSIPLSAASNLRIFNQSGQTMLTAPVGQNGTYQWNAAGIPSGLYFIELNSGQGIVTKPVTLLK